MLLAERSGAVRDQLGQQRPGAHRIAGLAGPVRVVVPDHQRVVVVRPEHARGVLDESHQRVPGHRHVAGLPRPHRAVVTGGQRRGVVRLVHLAALVRDGRHQPGRLDRLARPTHPMRVLVPDGQRVRVHRPERVGRLLHDWSQHPGRARGVTRFADPPGPPGTHVQRLGIVLTEHQDTIGRHVPRQRLGGDRVPGQTQAVGMVVPGQERVGMLRAEHARVVARELAEHPSGLCGPALVTDHPGPRGARVERTGVIGPEFPHPGLGLGPQFLYLLLVHRR